MMMDTKLSCVVIVPEELALSKVLPIPRVIFSGEPFVACARYRYDDITQDAVIKGSRSNAWTQT